MAMNGLNGTQTPRCGPNETIDAGVCVEQGPEWLAGLLFAPPGWVYGVLALGAVGVLGLGVAAHRTESIDRGDLREMVASAVIVGGCGAGALVFKELAIAGYAVDVLGGWAVGGGVGVLVARQLRGTDDPETGEDPDQQPTP